MKPLQFKYKEMMGYAKTLASEIQHHVECTGQILTHTYYMHIVYTII